MTDSDAERVVAKASLVHMTKHLTPFQLSILGLICRYGGPVRQIPKSVAGSLSLSERFLLHELLQSVDGRASVLEVVDLALHHS